MPKARPKSVDSLKSPLPGEVEPGWFGKARLYLQVVSVKRYYLGKVERIRLRELGKTSQSSKGWDSSRQGWSAIGGPFSQKRGRQMKWNEIG